MMNIYARPGQFVIATSEGLRCGTEEDIAHARQHLQVGRPYCVEYTVVGRYRTMVYLNEFPGLGISMAHFEVAGPPHPATVTHPYLCNDGPYCQPASYAHRWEGLSHHA
ncbi:MAG: hypothetical protein R2817_00790 [Flavobacteriales bacterium]